MNDRYGENTFCAEIRDSYSNMREIIDGHMELIENAQAALEKVTEILKALVQIHAGV